MIDYSKEDKIYEKLKDVHKTYFRERQFREMIEWFVLFLRREKHINIFNVDANEYPKLLKEFAEFEGRDKMYIPKKPELLIAETVYDLSTWICPCCNMVYSIKAKYDICERCGQKLDWSEE